jgi:hypothetical protein
MEDDVFHMVLVISGGVSVVLFRLMPNFLMPSIFTQSHMTDCAHLSDFPVANGDDMIRDDEWKKLPIWFDGWWKICDAART